jgi:hypothetical protein
MKLFVILILLLPTLAIAQLEVEVSTVDSSESRSVIELKAKNSGDQDIRNARVMVLMMDDEGKVVGTQSQWLHNPNDPNTIKTEVPAVESGKERSFNIVVKTKSAATQSKVICSRMVYGDGNLANPTKDFQIKKADE